MSIAEEVVASACFCSVGSGALASASGSAEAAIELLPCDASVAPSASGSDWVVASSLAHLLWKLRHVDLCRGERMEVFVRDGIER